MCARDCPWLLLLLLLQFNNNKLLFLARSLKDETRRQTCTEVIGASISWGAPRPSQISYSRCPGSSNQTIIVMASPRQHDDPASLEAVVSFVRRSDNLLAKYPMLCQYDTLREIEERTGAPKVVLFTGAVLTIILSALFFSGPSVFISGVGFIYPAWRSIETLESEDTEIREEAVKQWLTYWVVFSSFGVSEAISDVFISWVPFYLWIKLVFLVYCQSTYTNGARVIYKKILQPHFAKYGNVVENVMPFGRSSSFTKITLNLVEGHELPRCSRLGKIDPFVVITVNPVGSRARDGCETVTYTSTHRPSTYNPEWDETFTLEPVASVDAILRVVVKARGAVLGDEYVGEFEVPLVNLVQKRWHDDWYPLVVGEGRTSAALDGLTGVVHMTLKAE